MYISMDQLVQQWDSKEIDRDELVVMLANFTDDQVLASIFDKDIIKDVLKFKSDLDSGDMLQML